MEAESSRELFGIQVPRLHRDLAVDYAAFQSAAVLPSPWEYLIEITGKDRREFLQSMLTADVAGLRTGRCIPSASADRKGHLVADLWVFEGGNRFLLRVRKDRWPAVRDILDRHRVTEDVAWTSPGVSPGEDPWNEAPLLLLGRQAESAALALGLDYEEGTREGGESQIEEGPVRWMRIRETERSEFVLFLSGPASERLIERSGSLADRIVRIGWDAFDLRRIEAGTAWFGLDGNEERLVPEVLPEDRIDYRKGCYLGQEPLARLHHVGKQNWRLHRVKIEAAGSAVSGAGAEAAERVEAARTAVSADGAEAVADATGPETAAGVSVPARGSDVLGPDGSRAGWVTSAARHPDGSVLGLAYLNRRFTDDDADGPRSSPVPSPALHLSSGASVWLRAAAEGSSENVCRNT